MSLPLVPDGAGADVPDNICKRTFKTCSGVNTIINWLSLPSNDIAEHIVRIIHEHQSEAWRKAQVVSTMYSTGGRKIS